MSKKMITKEGARVGALIKSNKAAYYVADVDLNANIEMTIGCCNATKKTIGKNKCGFMLISSGSSKLIVISDVPTEYEINIEEWLNSLNSNDVVFLHEEINKDGSYESNRMAIEIQHDSPFKEKDNIRSNAFQYLRKNKLIVEESEEDDFLFDF
jgi:hypothetical protein